MPTSGILRTHHQGAGLILIKAPLNSRVCACQNPADKRWCQTIWKRSKTNTEIRGHLYFPLKCELSRRLPESWTWLFGQAQRELSSKTNARCFLENSDLQFQAFGRLGMKDKSFQMCCKVLSREMASIIGGQPVDTELENILS